jgi:hypothetical protein
MEELKGIEKNESDGMVLGKIKKTNPVFLIFSKVFLRADKQG